MLFDEIPFFYEMGVKPSDCWGYPIPGLPSCWNFPDRYSNIAEFDPDINSISAMGCGPNRLGWSFGHCFDTDHHVPGYTKVFRLGIAGILAQIAAEKSHVSPESASYDFLSAAEKSCQTVLTIARKFSEAADEQLKACTDKTKRQIQSHFKPNSEMLFKLQNSARGVRGLSGGDVSRAEFGCFSSPSAPQNTQIRSNHMLHHIFLRKVSPIIDDCTRIKTQRFSKALTSNKINVKIVNEFSLFIFI